MTRDLQKELNEMALRNRQLNIEVDKLQREIERLKKETVSPKQQIQQVVETPKITEKPKRGRPRTVKQNTLF